MKEVNINKIK